MESLPHTLIFYSIRTDINEHSDSMNTCSQNRIEADFLIPIAMLLSDLAIL